MAIRLYLPWNASKPKATTQAERIYTIFLCVDFIAAASALSLCFWTAALACIGASPDSVCHGIPWLWKVYGAVLPFYAARGVEIIANGYCLVDQGTYCDRLGCPLSEDYLAMRRRAYYIVRAARVVATVVFMTAVWGKPSLRCCRIDS